MRLDMVGESSSAVRRTIQVDPQKKVMSTLCRQGGWGLFVWTAFPRSVRYKDVAVSRGVSLALNPVGGIHPLLAHRPPPAGEKPWPRADRRGRRDQQSLDVLRQ